MKKYATGYNRNFNETTTLQGNQSHIMELVGESTIGMKVDPVEGYFSGSDLIKTV